MYKLKVQKHISLLLRYSHLGLLLFLLFINDFANISELCNVLFFADNIKLFLEISSDQDCLRMQSELNKIMNQCDANLLFLNFSKCFSISYSKHPNHFKFNYILENGTTRIRVNSLELFSIPNSHLKSTSRMWWVGLNKVVVFFLVLYLVAPSHSKIMM